MVQDRYLFTSIGFGVLLIVCHTQD